MVIHIIVGVRGNPRVVITEGDRPFPKGRSRETDDPIVTSGKVIGVTGETSTTNVHHRGMPCVLAALQKPCLAPYPRPRIPRAPILVSIGSEIARPYVGNLGAAPT